MYALCYTKDSSQLTIRPKITINNYKSKVRKCDFLIFISLNNKIFKKKPEARSQNWLGCGILDYIFVFFVLRSSFLVLRFPTHHSPLTTHRFFVHRSLITDYHFSISEGIYNDPRQRSQYPDHHHHPCQQAGYPDDSLYLYQ